MGKQVLDDWVVELGFDYKKVSNGVNKVDKLISKLEKTEARVTTQKSKQNDLEKRKIALLTKRNALQRKIETAERLGMKVSGFKQTHSTAKDPVKIHARTLELDRMITSERTKQRKEAEKEAAAKARAAASAAPKGKASGAKKKKAADGTSPIGFGERNRMHVDVERMKKKTAGLSTSRSRQEIDALMRRLDALKAKIDKTKSKTKAYYHLKGEMNDIRGEINKTTNSMKKQNMAAKALKNSLMNMARGFASVYLLLEGAKAIFRTIRDFDSLRSSLLAASGGAIQAGKDFEYIKNLSRTMVLNSKY